MAETNGNGNGNGKRLSLNLGDALHIIQIVTLLISLGIGIQKFQDAATLMGNTANRLERVEHYLSSKDSTYWDRTDKQ